MRNNELPNIDDWLRCNKLSVNIKKTNYVAFSPSQRKLNYSFSLSFGGQPLIQSNVTKVLEVCERFIVTGDCQAGARGRPVSNMQPSVAAYLEAMIFVNPFLYLEEMQGRLRADLNLLPVGTGYLQDTA